MEDFIFWQNQGASWQEEQRRKRMRNLLGFQNNRVIDRTGRDVTGQIYVRSNLVKDTWDNNRKNETINGPSGYVPSAEKKGDEFLRHMSSEQKVEEERRLYGPLPAESYLTREQLEDLKIQQESISNIVRPDFSWRLWESSRFLRKGNLAAAAHILDPDGNIIPRENVIDEEGRFQGFTGKDIPSGVGIVGALFGLALRRKARREKSRLRRAGKEPSAEQAELFKLLEKKDGMDLPTRMLMWNLGWMRKFGNDRQAEEYLKLKEYEARNPGQAKTYNNITRRSFLQIQLSAIGQEMMNSPGRPSDSLIKKAERIREQIAELDEIIPKFGLEEVLDRDIGLGRALKYFWAEQGPQYVSALATMTAYGSGQVQNLDSWEENEFLGDSLVKSLASTGMSYYPLLTMSLGAGAAIGAHTAGSTYADLILNEIEVPIFADDDNKFGVSQGGKPTVMYPGATGYYAFESDEGQIIDGRKVIGYARQEMPTWIAKRAAMVSGILEGGIEAVSLRMPFVKGIGLIPALRQTLNAVIANPLFKKGTRRILINGAGRWVREGALQTGEEVMQELSTHWQTVWAEEQSNTLAGTQYQKHSGAVLKIIKETINKAVLGSFALGLPGQTVTTVVDFKNRAALRDLLGKKELEDLIAGKDLEGLDINEYLNIVAGNIASDIDIALAEYKGTENLKEKVLQGELGRSESIKETGEETLYRLSEKVKLLKQARGFIKESTEDTARRKNKSVKDKETLGVRALETAGSEHDRVSVAEQEASETHLIAREIQINQTLLKERQERLEELNNKTEENQEEVTKQKEKVQKQIGDYEQTIEGLFKEISKTPDVVRYNAKDNPEAGEIELVRHIEDGSIYWEVRNVGEEVSSATYDTLANALWSMYTNTPLPDKTGAIYTAGGIANNTDWVIRGTDVKTAEGRADRIISRSPAMQNVVLTESQSEIKTFISREIDRLGSHEVNADQVIEAIKKEAKDNPIYEAELGKNYADIKKSIEKEIKQIRQRRRRNIREVKRKLESVSVMSDNLLGKQKQGRERAELAPYIKHLESLETIRDLSETDQKNIQELESIKKDIEKYIAEDEDFNYLLSKTLLSDNESILDMVERLKKVDRDTAKLEESLLKGIKGDAKLVKQRTGRAAASRMLKNIRKNQWEDDSVNKEGEPTNNAIKNRLERMLEVAERERKLAKKVSKRYKKDPVFKSLEKDIDHIVDNIIPDLLKNIEVARKAQQEFIAEATKDFEKTISKVKEEWLDENRGLIVGQFSTAVKALETFFDQPPDSYSPLLENVSLRKQGLATDALIQIAMHEINQRTFRGADNKLMLSTEAIDQIEREILNGRDPKPPSRDDIPRWKKIKESLVGAASSLIKPLLLLESIVPKGSLAKKMLFFGRGASDVQLARSKGLKQLRNRLNAHGFNLTNKQAEEYLNATIASIRVSKFGGSNKTKTDIPLTRGEVMSLALHLSSKDNVRHLVSSVKDGKTGGFSLTGYAEGISPQDVLVIDEGKLIENDKRNKKPTEESIREAQEETGKTEEEIDKIVAERMSQWKDKQIRLQREDKLKEVVEALDKEEQGDVSAKGVVEAVREFYRWSYKELNRTYKERTGVDLEFIDNYIGMRTVADQRKEGDIAFDKANLDGLSSNFLEQMKDGIVFLPEHFLQQRTKAGGAIYLDNIAKVMTNAIQETAVYTSLAHQMTDAVKLLKDQDIKSAFNARNQSYNKMLRKYLSDVVAEQSGHEWWDKVARKLRRNASRAFLGLNWGVSLSQALSAAVVSGMVNEKYMLQASTQIWGETGSTWEKLLRETSGIIVERLEGRIDPDTAASFKTKKDVATLTGQSRQPISDVALFGVKLVDKHTVKSIMIAAILQVFDQTKDVATWRGLKPAQKSELLDNVGIDEKSLEGRINQDGEMKVEIWDLAIKYAESVIWRSQPMFNAAHRSDLSRRGSEAIRATQAFRGWQDALFDLVGRNIISVARGEPDAVWILARSLVGSIVVGGLGMWTITSLRTHLRNLITGDDREPDKLWRKFLDVPFSAVPFVRELYNAFSFWLSSGYGKPKLVGTGVTFQTVTEISDLFHHLQRMLQEEDKNLKDYHAWEVFYQAFKAALIGGGLPYVFTYPVKGAIKRLRRE